LFQVTAQPMCVRFADSACSASSSSRYCQLLITTADDSALARSRCLRIDRVLQVKVFDFAAWKGLGPTLLRSNRIPDTSAAGYIAASSVAPSL